MAMLATRYDDQLDPTGLWMSEKLDGVRAVWDGQEFRSRGNKLFYVPEELKAGMPDIHLDGEFTLGRGRFQETVGVVRRKRATAEDWSCVRYMVFENPVNGDGFEDRHDKLKGFQFPGWVCLVDHLLCESREHLEDYLEEIVSNGGEGVMLSIPGSLYEDKRSDNLMKVKPIFNDEATVTGYKPGGGTYEGMTGALLCSNATGIEFAVGTGLTDDERENPPAIGSVITYAYAGLTNAGKPRHPAYVAVRDYE